MIILGVGTNLGDRLAHLRAALETIKRIPGLSIEQVSPIYLSDALLPEEAPNDWNLPYLNLAIRCETQLDPYTLLALLKKAEHTLGRMPEKNWGPRVIDIDILAWDDRIIYDEKLHIPHEHLHQRPFALWPLADVAPHWIYPLPGIWSGKTATELARQWGERDNANAPLNTKQIPHRIDTAGLMGIVNITPDSFSGDGLLEYPALLNHIVNLVNAGAEIIDLGAEATGPSAIPLDPKEEWRRLEPILQPLLAERSRMLIPPKISIDTRHADVAEKALRLGVDWINDVSGLFDQKMCRVVANSQCDIVFMHHLGVPVDKSRVLPLWEDSVKVVYEETQRHLEQLEHAGIARERLIFDVGIGYGKTAEQSLHLIKHISRFKELGTRLLVGHSRKSFLGQFNHASAKDRDLETLVVSQFLSKAGVDYLRIHNVAAHALAIKIQSAL